jgi:ATP-dependent Clp protease adapter protein ClpS
MVARGRSVLTRGRSPEPPHGGANAEGDDAMDAMVAQPRHGSPVETPDLEELERTDVEVAPPWMTVLHNCDCHTFEEVVKQLMKAIGCSEERGWELAWQVHNTGKAVVKIGPEAECVRVGNVLASIGLVVTVTRS